MQEIRAVVAPEFTAVNKLIVSQLRSDVALVENIGQYIVDAGGKRLRPLLVLLTAGACDYRGSNHIELAAIVEFIHTATLLHDDVVDLSSLRRGRPTANAEFGNAPSVLVGDFLYSRAFQLMVKLGDMDIMRNMADTTNTIAEGEVLQLMGAGDASMTESRYMEVITRKTAILFASACYGAATLAGVTGPQRDSLHAFGLDLGIAFQIADDILDYDGDAATMGKNVGDDLTEGKPTLPLIRLLEVGTEEQKTLVKAAIESRSAEQLEAIVEAVKSSGALAYTRDKALAHQSAALRRLTELHPGKHRYALQQIAEMAVNRDH